MRRRKRPMYRGDGCAMADGLRLMLVTLALLIAAACVSEPPGATRSTPISADSGATGREAALWEQTVSPYLDKDLWTDIHAYDAGHYLMIPLQVAFSGENPAWEQDFDSHVERFIAHQGELTSDFLDRLHYLYLLSRYAVLSADRATNQINEQVGDLLVAEVESAWHDRPTWQWAQADFTGMRARVLWKLETQSVEKSYYRAIIDEEFFLFAIAADLRSLSLFTNLNESRRETLDDILGLAHRVVEQESSWPEGGRWLFQPGVWTDHPDYAYAGNTAKDANLQPDPVPGIALDTSHSHRFARWLTSLRDASADGSVARHTYQRILDGLDVTFFKGAVVPPSTEFPAYRTSNFLDGWNGVFRWNYPTQGQGNGYGPYELSGTLLLGWWAFLDTPRACGLYADMANVFPLPEEVITTYVGPNTTRERDPIVSLPNFYQNGFAELISRLATRLC